MLARSAQVMVIWLGLADEVSPRSLAARVHRDRETIVVKVIEKDPAEYRGMQTKRPVRTS